MIKNSGTYSRKLSEKDRADIENLKNKYAVYFSVLNKCINRKYISKDEALKIKKSLAEKYYAEKFLIPMVNNLDSRINSIFSKSFGKIF